MPPSGIKEVQVGPYPMGQSSHISGQAQQPEINWYYFAQLYLHTVLNDVQKELYQESKLSGVTLSFLSIPREADRISSRPNLQASHPIALSV